MSSLHSPFPSTFLSCRNFPLPRISSPPLCLLLVCNPLSLIIVAYMNMDERLFAGM